MTIQINLDTQKLSSAYYVLPDNDKLELEITGKKMPNITYYLLFILNDKVQKIMALNGKFQVEIDTYGCAKLSVLGYSQGVEVFRRRIEDLYIADLDGQLKVIPEIEQYKDDMKVEIDENHNYLVGKLNEVILKQAEIINKLNDLESRMVEVENNYDITVIE